MLSLTSMYDCRGFLQARSDKILKLPDLGLITFPRDAASHPDLVRIDFSNNQMQSLPNRINLFTSIQSLNMSNNRLSKVPDTIGDLTTLTYLNIGTNNLESLPQTVGSLMQLNTLILNRNKLTILPLTVGRLTNLTELDVTDNHTTSPPVETVALGTKAIISFFNYLLQARVTRRLDMPSLGMEAFPLEIEYLTYLTSLDMSNNKSVPSPDGTLAPASASDSAIQLVISDVFL